MDCCSNIIDEEVSFDDNDLFLWMGQGLNERDRIVGWYYCREHGEFIKRKATKTAKCPFCGGKRERMMYLDPATKYSTIMRWKAQGTYSDLAADVNHL